MKEKTTRNGKGTFEKLTDSCINHASKTSFLKLHELGEKADPEITLKRIEQIPICIESAKEACLDSQTTIREGVKSSSDSVNRYYDACDTTLVSLSKIVEDETRSFDEKRFAIEEMNGIRDDMSKKDTEHKIHVEKMAYAGLKGFGMLVVGAIVFLGGKAIFESSDSEDEGNAEAA